MKSIFRAACVVALWGVVITPSFAQMSTFPPPPALAPSPKPPANPPAHNPSNMPVNSDFGIPTQGEGANSGTPSSNDSSPGNSGSQLPVAAGLLNSMSALDDKITLQRADRISFRVIEDKDPAVPRVVTDTGEVDFPYVGRVKVEGQTCHEVAIQLKKLLEIDYYKHATVIVGLDVIADRDKDKVKTHDLAWIVGQVRVVGSQEITKEQPLTVSQMILRAGGFGDFAEQRKVRVIHRTGTSPVPSGDSPSQDEQIIDIKAVFDGTSKIDPVVRPNDYIIVSKRALNL